MKFAVALSVLLIVSITCINAQNAYVKLGQEALMDGDFKQAVDNLEKACVVDSTNANALWMLGYSYYHVQNFKKAIITYNRVVEIKPGDCSAYYYRAMAKSGFAHDTQSTPADKEKSYLGAILDLTKAITINPADVKFYQNRGIFYRDYGVFKLQKANKFYDKTRAISSFKASVSDLEKILNEHPDRQDIASLLDQSKLQLAKAEAL